MMAYFLLFLMLLASLSGGTGPGDEAGSTDLFLDHPTGLEQVSEWEDVSEPDISSFGVPFIAHEMFLTAYFDEEQVRLYLADGRVATLPQTISASGARYSDGSILFWNYGDEARLELDGFTYLLQELRDPIDPWERARRSGVNFRAIGQEPGWSLEIRDGTRIDLTLDYGDTKLTTPIFHPQIDSTTDRIIYHTRQPTSPVDLLVTITEQTCYDVMSGEEFPAAVSVVLLGNGSTYHGCGRWLAEPDSMVKK